MTNLFTGCKDLSEMNEKRISLIKSGVDVVSVNNDFNAYRTSVAAVQAGGLVSTHSHMQVHTIHKPAKRDDMRLTGLSILGKSAEPNVLVITEQGEVYI